MKRAVARIAFVRREDTAVARQFASGLSHFAKPSHGFILREFDLGRHATQLPPSWASWSPDAVVAFIAANDTAILDALAEWGRPLVSTSRVEPAPGRAVVLGDAEELYTAVHEHFRSLGIVTVVQFVLGESLGAFGTRERYRRFAEARGIPFRCYSIPDQKDLYELQQMTEPDEGIAEWLRDLPRPIGVFSQQTYAGAYLCRTCELLNIAVPEEVAIIGSDGFDAALGSRPALTTIHVPGEAIGYEAGRIAASMLEGTPAPTDIVLVSGVRLVVRASTFSPRRTGCDIDVAMDFIAKHAGEGICVNDVLSHTQGVSRMTFHKKFVEAFGITPGEAIKERQLGEARRLLSETELSLGAIASMCGYCDYTHFYRVFRDAQGVGPRDYRKAMLG